MSEYERLNAELLNVSNDIIQYNSILYTATAAIFVFAFDKASFVFCLIPYIFIIPFYLRIQMTNKKVCEIAAYIYVFLEGDKYRWEGRHHKYDQLGHANDTKNRIKWNLHYHFLNLVCFAMSIYKILESSETDSIKLIQGLFISAILILATIIMLINETDYGKERNKAIKQWQAVKAAEEQEAQKRKNNRNPQ